MLVIAGTYLMVYPAAGLIRYFEGNNLIAINKTPIAVPDGTLMFVYSIGKVLSNLKMN